MATGPALRFRPAGGTLGPLKRPFPAGSEGLDAALDEQGNAYLVWTRAGTLEARVRRRDRSLGDIQTVQAGVLSGSGKVAVSNDGRAAFAWLAGGADGPDRPAPGIPTEASAPCTR